MYLNFLDGQLLINEQALDLSQFSCSISKDYMPLYGYKSTFFDAAAEGNSSVVGFFTLNRSFETGDLHLGEMISKVTLRQGAGTDKRDFTIKDMYIQSAENMVRAAMQDNVKDTYVFLARQVDEI